MKFVFNGTRLILLFKNYRVNSINKYRYIIFSTSIIHRGELKIG